MLFRILFWEQGYSPKCQTVHVVFFFPPFPLFYMKPNIYNSVILLCFLVNLFLYLQIAVLCLKTYLCLLSQNSAGEEKLRRKGYFGNCGWN